MSANANDWCEAYKRASTDNKRLRVALAEAEQQLSDRAELPSCMIGPSEPCEMFQEQTAEIARLRADLAEARELIDELNSRVDSWSATDDLKAKADAFLERTK